MTYIAFLSKHVYGSIYVCEVMSDLQILGYIKCIVPLCLYIYIYSAAELKYAYFTLKRPGDPKQTMAFGRPFFVRGSDRDPCRPRDPLRSGVARLPLVWPLASDSQISE